MGVLDPVVFGLGPAGVSRHAAGLAEGAEPFASAGEQLVDVGLVAGVPQDHVVGRMEAAV